MESSGEGSLYTPDSRSALLHSTPTVSSPEMQLLSMNKPESQHEANGWSQEEQGGGAGSLPGSVQALPLPTARPL